MIRVKNSVKKYNDYIESNKEKNLSECMYYLHDAYTDMDTEEKENAYIHTLVNFPETIGYAMLKLSSNKLNVTEKYYQEYKEGYKEWLENIETDLIVGFGDVGIFLTYARLYILGMNEHVDTLKERIERIFKERKDEREHLEWIHKKVF